MIAGIELIRSKAMSLVGMGGGGSGESRIMEKQGYYAGSDLDTSASFVSSKGRCKFSRRKGMKEPTSINKALLSNMRICS